MAQFKTSLVINRPVEEVFAFVSNYQNSPKWVSGAMEHTKISEGPIGVGAVIRTSGWAMGLPIEATRIVTAYEPHFKYAFKSEYRQVPLTTTFAFEPIQNGTRLTIVVEGEAAGLFKSATPFILGAIRRQCESDLRRLKKLLEERKRTKT
jgi:uncharacterized protein YndB with AHSA1/START domain